MAKEPNVIGGEDPKPGHWSDAEMRSMEAMADMDPVPRPPTQELHPSSGQNNANLIYILYLVNFAVPFLGIVGVIMAYSARDQAGPELRTHYDNQIRIFWITLIGYAVSFVLAFVLIGFLTGLAVAIWKVVRVATGMSVLSRGAPVRNVESFAFTSE
ncbi:MAG: DUF4870 domain-containing protein [Litorimonas sp.]